MKQTLISQDLDFQKSRCRLNGRLSFLLCTVLSDQKLLCSLTNGYRRYVVTTAQWVGIDSNYYFYRIVFSKDVYSKHESSSFSYNWLQQFAENSETIFVTLRIGWIFVKCKTWICSGNFSGSQFLSDSLPSRKFNSKEDANSNLIDPGIFIPIGNCKEIVSFWSQHKIFAQVHFKVTLLSAMDHIRT